MSSEALTEDHYRQAAERIVAARRRKQRRIALSSLLGVILLGWLAIAFFRVGIFVIQPIGAIPDGVTVIYVGRGDGMQFIDSPDAMCLRNRGGVSLLCRGMAASAFVEKLGDGILLRLPYSEALYLRSTGGESFER